MKIDLDGLRPLLEVALDRAVPELELDTHLYTDAGMDSMGAVALVVEIDRRFKVRLPEEEIPNLHTARQYLAAIEARVAGRPGEAVSESVSAHA
jgi:acyl carrier protein